MQPTECARPGQPSKCPVHGLWQAHKDIPCKKCREERPDDYQAGEAEKAAVAKRKAKNAKSNAKHNAKRSAELHATKKRQFDEMQDAGVIKCNDGQLAVKEGALSLVELEQKSIIEIKSLLTRLAKQDKAAFAALRGLLLGKNAFNVTKAGKHRDDEHVSKMQRPSVHIVKQDGSQLSKHDYNAAIFRFTILDGSMIASNINGMESTLPLLLAGPSWEKRQLCTNKNHGLR